VKFLEHEVAALYLCFMKHEHALIDYSSPAMQERMRLPEGTISEIISGELYVWKSAPNRRHQQIVREIVLELGFYSKTTGSGQVYFAPLDVYFDLEKTVLVPDITFTIKENAEVIFDDYGIIGPPDLVVEVLSPSTRRRDLTVKKRVYESSGVKEYWIIDPDTNDTWGYLLNNGRYDEPLMMHSEIHVRTLNRRIKFFIP
jgi:Uma2 family endonuclease